MRMNITIFVDRETKQLIKRVLKNLREQIKEMEREYIRWGYSSQLIPQFTFDEKMAKYVTCSGKGEYIIDMGKQRMIEIEFNGYRRSFLDGNLLLEFRNVPEFPKKHMYLTVVFKSQQPDKLPMEIVLTGRISRYETSMPQKPLKKD